MKITIYCFRDKLIVPTMSRTKAGYYLETEPVGVASLLDREEMERIVLEAPIRGNPDVPTPSRNNFPKPIVPGYAGARSWRTFVEEASCWLAEKEVEHFMVTPQRPDSNSAWWGDRTRKVDLLRYDDLQETAKLILNSVVDARHGRS